MSAPADTKVVLKTADGMYVTGEQGNLRLSNDVYGAMVFDYRGDQIAERLQRIQRLHGLILTAAPLILEDIFETCDRCKQMVIPLKTFFDGQRFLCEDCKQT